jgi:hypothetical protein
MALLAWLARVLLIMFVAQLVLRLLFGRRSVASRRPSRPAGGGERVGGALVRDPQCGTFIPPARAIQVGSGAGAQYFCSEGCRAAYAAAHRR